MSRGRSDLGGDVIIDGAPYVLHQDKDGHFWRHTTAERQEGNGLEPISAAWQQGYFNGMGHTKMVDPSDLASYAYSVGLHAATYPWVEMAGRRVSVTPTAAPTDVPTFFFETGVTGTVTAEAITQAPLTSGSDTTKSTFWTAAFTPTANRLVLFAVHVHSILGAPTVSVTPVAGGATLPLVASVSSGTEYLYLFRMLRAAQVLSNYNIGTGLGSVGTTCRWAVSEFGGVNISGTDGSGAIRQSVTGTATATSLTVTLAAFAAATNGAFGAFASDIATAVTPGAGLTEIYDVAAYVGDLQTEWKATSDTTVDASGTSRLWLGIAVELQAAYSVAAAAPYIYCLNGRYSTKTSIAANVITQEHQKDFGATATLGKPATSGGVIYVPLGTALPFQRLPSVAEGTGDPWAADTKYAVAFATLQDGYISRVARAYADSSVVARDVALTGDGGATWGEAFQIGEATTAITCMDDSGTALSITKADGNLYRFDPTGASTRLSSEPVGISDSNNGVGLIAIEGTDAAIWNSLSGLQLFRGDALPHPIGPDSLKVNRNVAGLTHEPVKVRHYETAVVGKWVYSLARVTESGSTKTYVIAAEKVGDGFVLHTFDRVDGILRGVFVDSQMRLWSAYVTGATILYWKLGADGSPDPGRDHIGFGTVSTTYSFITSEWDGGLPWTLKYLEHVELIVSGLTGNAGMTLSVWATIDDGTAVQIGSNSTSVSQYQTFYTGTTLRSGRRFTLEVRLVTDNGTLYVPANRTAPFRIHAMAARFLAAPGTNDVVKFTLTSSRSYANGAEQQLDAKAIRDAMKALAGTPATPGSIVTCIDPDGATVYLRVTNVDDRQITIGETVQYLIDVEAMQYRAS